MNFQIINRGPYFSIITRDGQFAGMIAAFPDAIVTVNLVGGMAHVGFQNMEEAQAFVNTL